jgi:UDP-GlcNAc:undecaprenyl-phosphate/decaprenyl-phosphate GlcNAc-1-phosphate transferase
MIQGSVFMFDFLATMMACAALIVGLRAVCVRVGLIDIPGGRKAHTEATPLVGGVAMFLAVVGVLFWGNQLSPDIAVLMGAGMVIVLLGILDDRFDLPVILRLVTQVLVSLAVILFADGKVLHIGNIFGADLALGLLAIPFSMVAFVGGMNSINMIDGADGVAGKMGGITLLGVAVILYHAHDKIQLPLVWAMLGALTGFLFFNARIFVRHAWVFMGDSGSMWLGLVLGWFMAEMTRGSIMAPPPIVFWLFGLPVIDTLAVMLHRISQRRSPFMSDRAHIHHMLEHAGLSVGQTVMTMSLMQLLLVASGVLFYLDHVSAAVIFWSFALLFGAYYYLLHHEQVLLRRAKAFVR